MSDRDKRLDIVLDSVQDSLDIGEAAARLGLSQDTVRKRLQRGKIKGFKAADGAWRVVLDRPDTPGQQPGHCPGQTGQTPGQPNEALVEALRDEIRFLRVQLTARDEEIRRAHVLLQQSQQTATVLLSAPRLPWWRRWFKQAKAERIEG